MYDKVLLEARVAHRTRTKHTHVFIGMNFVECLQCRKHAHLTFDGMRLIVHNANHEVVETIDAEDF